MAFQVVYKYKTQVPDEVERKAEGIKVKRRFLSKIPLVVGRVNMSELPDLEKSKFLFPAAATVHNLSQFINSKMRRPENDPLYIYVQNEIIASKESTMAELYQEYREDDYFLYVAYYEKNLYESESRSRSSS